MTLKPKVLLLLILSLAPIARGSITVNVNADALNGIAGTGSPAPVNALVALVADTDNLGIIAKAGSFGSISGGGFLDTGSNTDLILGLRTLGTTTLEPGSYIDSFTGLSFSGNWAAGDNLYLVWFPTYTIATTSSTAGDKYGIISLGATPSDGGADTFNYITSDSSFYFNPPGGSDPITIANLTVQPVPEPSSFFVLAGLGLLGFLRRRVRQPAN